MVSMKKLSYKRSKKLEYNIPERKLFCLILLSKELNLQIIHFFLE